MKIIKFFSIFFLIVIQQFSYVEANDFNDWIVDFKKRALNEGISSKTVNSVMDKAIFLPKVIEYDRYQPEFYEDTSTYINKRVNEEKIKKGLNFYIDNSSLIEEIENQGLNGIGLEFSTVEPETSTVEESSTEDTISFVSDITAFKFDDITVIVGTEVKWVNKHSEFHTVTGKSSTDLLDSPQLSQGASYSFKFNEPGKYQFICQFHGTP